MHWIINFLLSHKNGASFFLTIFMSLFMLGASSSTKTTISSSLTMSIFAPIQIFITQTKDIRNIYAENRSLKDKIAKVTMKNSQLLKDQDIENSLATAFNIRESFTYDLIAARVIAQDPSSLFRTIILDRGSQKGVKLYMPVIGVDGVVGKVIRVAQNSSLVQLIRAPDEYLSVTHKTSGAVAIVSAHYRDHLSARFRKHYNIKIGDSLSTSGFGGIYPPNIAVGVVTDIDTVSNPLYSEIKIKPTVKFYDLRTVFIVALDSQWSAFKEEIDSLRTEDVQ